MNQLSLLSAEHFFLQRDWGSCVTAANAYFESKFGQVSTIPEHSIPSDHGMEWSVWMIEALLQGDSQFPLGLFAREIWIHQPSQRLLECLAFLDWRRIRHLQYHPSELAFASAFGNCLVDFLVESARIGIIQPSKGSFPIGMLPELAPTFWEKLEEDQLNDYYAIKIRYGITAGLSLRDKVSVDSMEKQELAIWLRTILAFLYTPMKGRDFLRKRVDFSCRKYPDWAPVVEKIINRIVELSLDDELAFLLQDYVSLENSELSASQLLRLIANGIKYRSADHLPVIEPRVIK